MVAHARWTVTDDAMDSPFSIDQTVQRTSGVALKIIRERGSILKTMCDYNLKLPSSSASAGFLLIPNITAIVVRSIVYRLD